MPIWSDVGQQRRITCCSGESVLRQLSDLESSGTDTSVESRMGAVAWGLWPALRFPSPLIEPDVPISGIRLSDWLHRKAHSGADRGRRSRHSTPWLRWIACHVNRRLPRPATLCRLARKARTRSRT
jgi:hypothetical protein